MEDDDNPPGGEDELILSIWEGDENAKAQLIMRYFPALERSIGGLFRRLNSGEIEDVIAEAIRRFWVRRDSFDPSKQKLEVCLYHIAKQVAAEYTSGRLKWQKARLLEQTASEDDFGTVQAAADDGIDGEIDDKLDELEVDRSPLLRVFQEEFAKLSAMEQDVLQAYADAGEYQLEASQLGIELGHKYQGGVPYTGVNIRVTKHRARQKLFRVMKDRGFDLKDLGYTNE